MSPTPTTISREPDTELDRAGAKTKARYYKTSMKTPMGVFSGQIWTDSTGLILRAQLTMPFGTVTADLK